jgi:hypothetical protein
MPSSPSTVASLRELLTARFPQRARACAGHVATEIRALDLALGGGLACGRFTEIVSPAPGTGGQTIIAQVLRTTRRARQRLALIDGADGFAPSAVPPDHLRHLIWVRGRNAADVFSAADIVLRDGNYAIVILDVRGLAERTLLRTPVTTWHRLRHAAETSAVATLVLSASPIVPAVPTRLVLRQTVPLMARRTPRNALADGLAIEVERGHLAAEEKSA